jgi:hypothetical protein
MTRKKSLATVTIALVAGMVGYIIGPPIVQAATSAVKITSGSTASQLKISSGMAKVDTEAVTTQSSVFTTGPAIVTQVDFGLVLAEAAGQNVIGQGASTNASACPNTSIVAAIVADGATNSGNVTITVTGDTDFNGSGGDPVWQGTLNPGDHIDDTMDGGIFVGGPLAVNVSGTGANWYVYGLCFSSAAAAKSPIVRAIMHSHRLLAATQNSTKK